jgi:hypothetical protein
VVESITIESADTPENSAEAVKSAISKLVPVKTIVVSVLETDSIVGKDELEDCSYWHKVVSELIHAYVMEPCLIES